MGAGDPQLVEGYCDRLSYEAGEHVGLHLAVTRPGVLGDVVPGDRPMTVDLTVYREGAGRTEVHRQSGVPVEPRDVPSEAASSGAGWPETVRIPVDPTWAPGFHLVEITTRGEGARTSHAGFVVRAPRGAPTSPVLLVLATNTWNAYNDWGGSNLYTGGTQVSFDRPFARGYLQRPDPAGVRNACTLPDPDPDVEYWIRYMFEHGVSPWSACAGWASWEALFAAWAERAGYRLDYAVNSDLAEDPGLADSYRLLLSVGHDEYWSWEMRDAVEQHADRGGNVAFLSGNTAFWQVRLEDGGRTMVGYKMTARTDDPVVGTADEHRLTSMWCDPRIGRPEAGMTGVSFSRGGYARIGGSTPRASGGYTVWRPEHWLFDGTGLTYGDQLGADHVVVGYECDGCELALEDGRPVPTGRDGCPEGFEVLASAPAHLWSIEGDVNDYPAGLAAMRTTGELQEMAAILLGDDSPAATARLAYGHAVLGTYRRGPGQGTVVTTGCTDWTFGLHGGDPVVDQITRTLLDRLSEPA